MKKIFHCFVLFVYSNSAFSQGAATPSCDFWRKVQFGGGVGLNIGGGFTNISLAPSGIYNFNESVSLGVGLQGSFVSANNNYSSLIYGGSLIGLYNPTEQFQLSAELEQLKVNTSYDSSFNLPARRFWNTALHLGVGFRSGNVTVGARYNVLFKKDDAVYSDAFMPFVRVYF